MMKTDVQALAKSAQVIGQDRLVELRLLQPGIIIGVWKVILTFLFINFLKLGYFHEEYVL